MIGWAASALPRYKALGTLLRRFPCYPIAFVVDHEKSFSELLGIRRVRLHIHDTVGCKPINLQAASGRASNSDEIGERNFFWGGKGREGLS